MVEGIIIGLMGSIIPISVMIGVYIYLFDMSNGVLLGVFNLVSPNPFLIYLSLGLLGIGIVVGFVGSYLSVSKLLRNKR